MKSYTGALLMFISCPANIFFSSLHPWTCGPQRIGDPDHGTEYQFTQGHEMGRCTLPLPYSVVVGNESANVRKGP